ncbi:hypothetical protein D3C75_1103400 [compost metagenome]
MWEVPVVYRRMLELNREYLSENMIKVNSGSFHQFEATREKYIAFAEDFIKRVEVL